MANRVSQGGITVPSELVDQPIVVSQGGVTVPGELISQPIRISQSGVTVVAVPLPDPPTGLAGVPTGTTTVQLTWTNNVMDRTALWIQRGPDGIAWTDTIIIGPDATGYPDAGLTPATTYYYRIAAVYNGVVGPYSAAINVTTLAEAGGIFGTLLPVLLWLDDLA